MVEQQQQHQPGGHYSGANPVPTVKKFLENLDRDKKERDKRIEEDKVARKEAKSGGGVVQQELSIKESQQKVTDPTTGHEAVIEDVNPNIIKAVDNPKLSVPNANISKNTPVKTDPSQSGEEYRRNQDVTAPPAPVAPKSTTDVPIHGEKTNILFHPTPSTSYEPTFNALENKAGALAVGIFLSIIILGRLFGGALKGLVPLAICITSGIWLWTKEVVRSGREVEWDSEKERGVTATANLLPESVEWLNTLMGVVWGLINPDMFQGVADTLEDVMQASVPGVIENVRVAEINQGSNPLRVLSLRALPDSHMHELKKAIHEKNKETKDPQEAAADEEGGDFYNLEIAFAYHAAPSGKRASEKARNMHMQLVFYLGIKGLFGVPLPIFVELQSVVGTVRLRLNMTAEPPFLKTLTFTLMGTPHVQAGCIPMVEKGVNILNLPLISNFVNYAIGAAASMYVAPKSMSIDMRAILQGDSVKKDTLALGIMWIRIHRAVGLSKQDRRGSKHGGSDPYITLTFSKYGKPMYCTRVIIDDLNPIWEESTALLVTPELIKADENLSVELWDSDRHTADDVVGKVELSMQKMIQHPSKMYPQVSKLAGMQAESTMPGELHWEVGYFSKPHFRPALRTDGKNKTLPKELQDKPEFQDDKGKVNSEDDDAVMHTPPDPLWPSGVCSIVVHQIVNLEYVNIKGTQGTRKGREYEPAKKYGENTEEQGKDLPTSYCTIHFNDELVYRTRSKAVSSQPIFNAGTERFMRDWKSGIVTVTVRDQRHREHDPILGIVPIKVSDILETSTQVTRWYPLDGGIGFGRVRISLLFRNIETRLPPNLIGWDVGTFEFTSDNIEAFGIDKATKINLRTGGSTGIIPRNNSRALVEGNGYSWSLNSTDKRQCTRLPVKYRYRSPIVFEFVSAAKRSPDAWAVLWLQTLVDNEDTPIDLPIWWTANSMRLTQNYITEENCHNEVALEDLKEVGRLKFIGRFKAGMDESHAQFIADNDSRETYEMWEACLSEGVRSRTVDNELSNAHKLLHEQSLTEGRDLLMNADEEEKAKWLSKDGLDWSGAFGHDPRAYMDGKGRKKREPGREPPIHDPYHPSSDEDHESDIHSQQDQDGSSADLGIQDATNKDSVSEMNDQDDNAWGGSSNDRAGETTKQTKHAQERKHRGLMQWKPARNTKFAKDEGKIGLRKLKNKLVGGLDGRKPGVETELG